MDCEEIQEQLSAFLDRELEEDLRLQISRHLSACPICQAELATLKRLDAALAELEAPVPQGLAAGTLRRLPHPTTSWRRALALAACLVLGISLGGSLTGILYPVQKPAQANGDMASLEIFQDHPQGSLGGTFSYQGEEDNSA